MDNDSDMESYTEETRPGKRKEFLRYLSASISPHSAFKKHQAVLVMNLATLTLQHDWHSAFL